MKIRTVLLTAVTGLALSGAAATDALAQYRYGDGDRGYTREYRDRGSRGGRDYRAREIVARAYRDILRREPDRSGLRQYTDAMVRRGWSENDVRRALRESDEYRDNFGRSRGRRYDRYYR
jgi:hypothetical protein